MAVARRNERERNRVKMVNLGFATLRQHIPNGAKNKKMSKVETLRSAVEYISQLQALLNQVEQSSNHNNNSSKLYTIDAASNSSMCSSTSGSGDDQPLSFGDVDSSQLQLHRSILLAINGGDDEDDMDDDLDEDQCRDEYEEEDVHSDDHGSLDGSYAVGQQQQQQQHEATTLHTLSGQSK